MRQRREFPYNYNLYDWEKGWQGSTGPYGAGESNDQPFQEFEIAPRINRL